MSDNHPIPLRARARDVLLDHHLPRALRWRGERPSVRVAMFHTGRCGSTVLGELLAAQGEVFWAGEIFEGMPERYGALARAPDAPARILRRSQAEPYSLRSVVRRREYPPRYRVYGFETKYRTDQHLRPEWVNLELGAYIALLEAQGFDRFIVLRRHNHLRKLASGIAGKRSGLWHTRRPVRGPARVALPVEDFRFGPWRGTLLECLRDLDAQHERLLAELAGRRVLHLSYEEHISDDPGVAYRAVCTFLGIAARPVAPTLTKTNPFPLEDIVSNWDEVRAALEGTPYAWMLRADLPPAGPRARLAATG